MMVRCEDCARLTSGDCGRHGPSTFTVLPNTALEFKLNLDPVPLRCKHSGNPCGTDTVAVGQFCACTPCRQWQAAFDQGVEAEKMRRFAMADGQIPVGWVWAPARLTINNQAQPLTRTCPACSGSGIYIDYGGTASPVVQVACGSCNGSGRLP